MASKKEKTVASGSAPSSSTSMVKNGMVLMASVLLFIVLKSNVTGYGWVFDTLIKKNLQQVKQYKNLTVEQKLGAKLGADVNFLLAIKQHTPDTAVILMPPKDVVFPADNNTEFNYRKKSASISNSTWAGYFVYPRKLVYEDVKSESKYADQITHVAVVNFWGYEQAGYAPNSKVKNTILEVKK